MDHDVLIDNFDVIYNYVPDPGALALFAMNRFRRSTVNRSTWTTPWTCTGASIQSKGVTPIDTPSTAPIVSAASFGMPTDPPSTRYSARTARKPNSPWQLTIPIRS